MRRIGGVLGILVVAVGCPSAETPEQTDARMAAEAEELAAVLDSAYDRMLSYVGSEDADAIAAMYAPDARLFAADEPLVVGRDAIRAKYAEWFSQGNAEFANERIGLTVNGPLAVERTRWTMTLTAEPGAPPREPVTVVGKNITVWRKIGDRWLITDDIGNNDEPTTMPGGGD